MLDVDKEWDGMIAYKNFSPPKHGSKSARLQGSADPDPLIFKFWLDDDKLPVYQYQYDETSDHWLPRKKVCDSQFSIYL